MATKKVTTRSSKATKSSAAARTIDQRMSATIGQAARQAGLSPAQVTAQQSATVGYYLLIDFGFTSGQPFVPNSVQFYSSTGTFLCHKGVDNASLASLVPILNCPTIRVTWNTTTQEAVHIYGKKP